MHDLSEFLRHHPGLPPGWPAAQSLDIEDFSNEFSWQHNVRKIFSLVRRYNQYAPSYYTLSMVDVSDAYEYQVESVEKLLMRAQSMNQTIIDQFNTFINNQHTDVFGTSFPKVSKVIGQKLWLLGQLVVQFNDIRVDVPLDILSPDDSKVLDYINKIPPGNPAIDSVIKKWKAQYDL